MYVEEMVGHKRHLIVISRANTENPSDLSDNLGVISKYVLAMVV